MTDKVEPTGDQILELLRGNAKLLIEKAMSSIIQKESKLDDWTAFNNLNGMMIGFLKLDLISLEQMIQVFAIITEEKPEIVKMVEDHPLFVSNKQDELIDKILK